MQPANRARIFSCASLGDIQLLFGPASSLLRLQTKVRCSTRATSEGFERARWQPGNSFSFSSNRSPLACSWAVRRSISSSEPSHQYTEAGWVRLRTDSTHSVTSGQSFDRGRIACGAVAMRFSPYEVICSSRSFGPAFLWFGTFVLRELAGDAGNT